MIISARFALVALVGALLFTGNAFALPALEGVVKASNGSALSGAEILVQTPDSGATVKVARTDAAGRYSCSGLSAAVYRVNLVVNGALKASIKNVKVALGDATQLNFELKQGRVMPQGKGKHYVWLPSSTGSHIAGRWVEVDDRGNATTADNERIERSGGELIRRIQDNVTGRTTDR